MTSSTVQINWPRQIQAGSGTSGYVSAGQTLKITDVEGQQVADLVTFAAHDPTEFADVTYTTFARETWKLGKGTTFVTNRMRPIWTITEDTCGVHYAGGGFCSRELNTLYSADQPGCYETIVAEMQTAGFSTRALNPASCFNVFMNLPYAEDGTLRVAESVSRPGDYVELKAEMDLFWAVSVCNMPGPCNGPKPTSMKFEVRN